MGLRFSDDVVGLVQEVFLYCPFHFIQISTILVTSIELPSIKE